MIDILVPILGRPPNAMLRSLEHATSVPFEVFFICSPGHDDDYQTCLATGRPTWIVPWEPGRADYAKKINYGYEHTDSPWVFNGADDIRFYPGWDTEALRVAEETGKVVIGTNDLHNPSVLNKIHATHILFARSYIEEEGGTLDGVSPVFSETYDHQYVDNEFVELARRRSRWVSAEKSIVEHLHPAWGLVPWDETYGKAFRESVEDQRLFAQRVRLYRGRRYPKVR